MELLIQEEISNVNKNFSFFFFLLTEALLPASLHQGSFMGKAIKNFQMNQRKIILFILVALFVMAGSAGLYFYHKKIDYPVDLVYLWVDGDDIAWLKKKITAQAKETNLAENAIDEARFREFDELKYALRSVEQNLPWINHIYIITDNQVPDWLNTDNPKVSIIDHTEIFPEDALPVFNSNAIEAQVPYIPGLSEHFLLSNDDCYVRVPLDKDFFFNNKGDPRVYVKYKKRTYDTNLWLAQIKKAHELITEKYPLNFVVTPSHNIDAYRKSYYLDTIKEFPEEFKQTTYSKFRRESNINRIIVSLRDRMLNRNEMYENHSAPTLPTSCNTAFALISNDFDTLFETRPCLFCLNDYEGKSDISLSITQTILEGLFPEKSSFEK